MAAEHASRAQRVGTDALPSPEEVRRKIREEGFYFHGCTASRLAFVALCRGVGRLVPQYDGKAYGLVRPDRAFEGVYHTQNRDALDPHTECVEFQGLPPRYLALYCISGDTPDGPAGRACRTKLASVAEYFDSLPAEERETLGGKYVQFCSTPGLMKAQLGKPPIHHPFVEPVAGNRVFRFSVRCMRYDADPDLARFVGGFREFFERFAREISWSRGNFLVWDNYRMAHARTVIQSTDRCLLRLWIDE